MNCPLCNNDVEQLHKRSHILPEWMYKDYYDDNHKLVNVELDNKHVNKKQKGVYAEYIICKDCENESQRYDRYGSLILTDRSPRSREFTSVNRILYEKSVRGNLREYTHWKNIDFPQFQRFIFACVLRAHLSEKQKGKYLLVDKHFENMRQIYKDLDVTDDKTYPILISQYYEDDNFKDHVIMPFINRKSGHHFIEFSGAGYSFWIYVSSHRKDSFVESMSLRQDGSLYMLKVYFQEGGTFNVMSNTLSDLAIKYPNV